ncbi:hypothetical protein BCF44_13933 [Kutzneria buriramensis]|uniref:Uncharacterized protein n=1 Tax=Kutzneria buriramensis TaxID=1045776 RepID=A0A3E0G5G1_9PSEU|nr:hypothetical protein BCF44_13933 [Kutzneria buriramensis]
MAQQGESIGSRCRSDEFLLVPLGIGLQAIQLWPYRAGLAARSLGHLQTAAASLTCCCPLQLSPLGKPGDPRTSLRVHPSCAGDTTKRLTARSTSTRSPRVGSRPVVAARSSPSGPRTRSRPRGRDVGASPGVRLGDAPSVAVAGARPLPTRRRSGPRGTGGRVPSDRLCRRSVVLGSGQDLKHLLSPPNATAMAAAAKERLLISRLFLLGNAYLVFITVSRAMTGEERPQNE